MKLYMGRPRSADDEALAIHHGLSLACSRENYCLQMVNLLQGSSSLTLFGFILDSCLNFRNQNHFELLSF